MNRGLGHPERVRHAGPVTPGACVMRASWDHLLLAVLGAGAVTTVLGAGAVPGVVTPAGMVAGGGAARYWLATASTGTSLPDNG